MLSWMTSLADATRARTLRLVERHELTVADLCAILQAPQSTVSRHLKVLADEGWVTARPGRHEPPLPPRERGGLDPAARRLWSLLREQTARMPVAEQDDHRLARWSRSAARARRPSSRRPPDNGTGCAARCSADASTRSPSRAARRALDRRRPGCGTGQIAETLAPFVAHVVAVESARAMLKAARQRLGALENVRIEHGEPRSCRSTTRRSTRRPCASCCTTSPTRPPRSPRRTACSRTTDAC